MPVTLARYAAGEKGGYVYCFVYCWRLDTPQSLLRCPERLKA